MKSYIYFPLLFLYSLSFSQTGKLSPAIIANIQQRIEAGTNPGVVIGIIDKEGSHYYSFGKMKKGGKKVNEHSIYEIGSISKVFTTTLLADQIVKGELSSEDPIDKFLPAYVHVPKWNDQPITLGQLADHTSSLPRLPGNFTPADPANPYADYSAEKMYAFLSGYKLPREPGSEYEYSNLAVGLLGHILSMNAGKTYEDLISSTITGPLKMNETKIRLTRKMKKKLATGHHEGEPVGNWDLGTMAGAGGIRSSVYDMLIFLKANLEMMQHPLQEAMRLTHEPRHNKAGKNRVGLGWHIQDGKNGDIIWHNGSTGGYSSFTGFTKESGRGVVVMTNSTQGVDDIGFHLLDSSRPLENVVPHIATKLKAIIDAEGASNLMIKYDRLKKENAENFDFSETGINALGYYYLNRKRFEEAIAVFMLNISEYPGSSNVYDSYAEALMESGQTALAIENYKKSLDINPGNTNAVSMLAKMGVEIELPEVKVDESILESYTGTYELAPGFNIVITREGGKLLAQATGQDAYEIFGINNTRFYYKVVDAQIVFNKDKSGVTESLTLYQGGREISGRKK